MRFVIVITLTLLGTRSFSQKIVPLNTSAKASFRGLSVVDDNTVWVSGSNGTVGRSVDAGKTWTWLPVPGFEKRDFRDIEAFDKSTAIIIAVDTPALILKTTDGGKTWKTVYENHTPGMFLDAMEFWNDDNGIVVGDPIKGKFFIARSFDGGNTWTEVPVENAPAADSGEACFAASGTNVRILSRDMACLVSGGTRSRLFIQGAPINLPIIQGAQTTGANSIAIRDNNKLKDSEYFVVVGGDFSKDTLKEKNCFITKDGGKTWIAPATPPNGYRSCVEFIDKNKLITSGTSGVDISNDGGLNWRNISKEGYHVCRKAKKGKAVYLAGGKGRIAKLENN
ncbi:WD40/YVTN/BNR-like repeat-containing protein [Pinibacter aurantiacus]|uniref:Oxidoreductase n=1 Tax=Pinibacter aurantiacus TaxID=2851599 RepID=A0A9E2S9V0_9BACT|nr:oxidoreductase [Pinibacter aurantiacus]MBV4356005.1 oxidoreductase [Pinibacter aurantiacus]